MILSFAGLGSIEILFLCFISLTEVIESQAACTSSGLLQPGALL